MSKDDTPDANDNLVPGTSRTEQIFIRLTVLQTILAMIGIFTGAVALYAALTEADAVRKQQAAMVLPEIVVGDSHQSGDTGLRSSYVAFNWGIGPGRVRAVRLTYKDKAYRDWRSYLDAIGAPENVSYVQSQFSGRTIPAGEVLPILTLDDSQAARALQNAGSEKMFEVCYCSVFDDCWMMPEKMELGPQKVKVCPDFGDESFLQ